MVELGSCARGQGLVVMIVGPGVPGVGEKCLIRGVVTLETDG